MNYFEMSFAKSFVRRKEMTQSNFDLMSGYKGEKEEMQARKKKAARMYQGKEKRRKILK